MLDSRIRDFEVPAFMQVTPGTASGNALCVVQAWTHMTREVGARVFRLITDVAGYSCYPRSDPQPAPAILHTGPRRGLLGESQVRHLGRRRIPGGVEPALVS